MKSVTSVSVILSVTLLAAAASAHEYSITWYTIDAGGGTSAGGTYTLSGTIGQPDAHAPRTSQSFTESGGFWTGIPCAADFNADGVVNSQDFFDFLAAFFAGEPAADFNADALINSQDFFDFLGTFFAGC